MAPERVGGVSKKNSTERFKGACGSKEGYIWLAVVFEATQVGTCGCVVIRVWLAEGRRSRATDTVREAATFRKTHRRTLRKVIVTLFAPFGDDDGEPMTDDRHWFWPRH